LGVGGKQLSVLLFAAALGSLAVIATEGCTVVVSDEPLEGGVFDGNLGDETPLTNGCNECLFQQCAGSWAVCQNDTECLAIYACATKPNCDQRCIDDCFCGHPGGQNAYVAIAACDSFYQCGTCQAQCGTPATSCTAPGLIARDVCGTTPAQDAGADTAEAQDAEADAVAPPQDAAPTPTDAAAAVQSCTSCTNGKCSDLKSQCGPSSECEAYTLCLAACQDAACFDKCATDHATGKIASQALENCTLTNCTVQCGL
jgi:hypothetical protein